MTLQTNNEPFVIPPDRLDPILDDGVLTQRMYSWMQSISDRIPIDGDGSPESIITARIGRIYIDRTAQQFNRIYIKTTDSGATGWELQ